MTTQETINGRVMRLQSGFYQIQTEEGIFTCHMRGRLKRGPTRSDRVAIGDLVRLTPAPDACGSIEEILPRRSILERSRGEYRQVLLANVDQLLLVFACTQPTPHLRMLDRFLVMSEKQAIPPLIVVNKVDLLGLEVAQQIFSIYSSIGYRIIYTSVAEGYGINELRQTTLGKLSALTGPSGVGKTSLLKAIQPGLEVRVNEVSQTTFKGQHTTVVRQVYALDNGGLIADMPGLRSLALWDVQPEEMDGYFPELRDLVQLCQFNNCTHQHEPGCAVRAAVESGQVHPDRYQSYIRLCNNELT